MEINMNLFKRINWFNLSVVVGVVGFSALCWWGMVSVIVYLAAK
jgi:hypothetical protein